MNIEELQRENMRLLHAMQSGVAFTMPSKETEPKHLRTGLNNALCILGALSELLISKGILSEEEYWTTINKYIQADIDSYTAKLGPGITLG